MLTLKAMAWKGAALTREWARQTCPRIWRLRLQRGQARVAATIVAMSHRSADAKPTLIGMALWGSARCAIDANYVPAWETNTAMVWACSPPRLPLYVWRSGWLPAVRVVPPRNRAHRYLVQEGDFLAERWVLDVPLPQLEKLDTLAAGWHDVADEAPLPGTRVSAADSGVGGSFSPPGKRTCSAPRALRLINCKAIHPNVANGLAAYLVRHDNADQFGALDQQPWWVA